MLEPESQKMPRDRRILAEFSLLTEAKPTAEVTPRADIDHNAKDYDAADRGADISSHLSSLLQRPDDISLWMPMK